MLDVLNYSLVRQNLAKIIDRVCDAGAPVVVSRRAGKASVVLMSLDDYNAMQETMHLMSSPANLKWLSQSLAHAENGQLSAHQLVEE